MAHTLKNQDAWLQLQQFNQRTGFPYRDHELRQIHVKWRSIGKLANQPASLRNAENHN